MKHSRRFQSSASLDVRPMRANGSAHCLVHPRSGSFHASLTSQMESSQILVNHRLFQGLPPSPQPDSARRGYEACPARYAPSKRAFLAVEPVWVLGLGWPWWLTDEHNNSTSHGPRFESQGLGAVQFLPAIAQPGVRSRMARTEQISTQVIAHWTKPRHSLRAMLVVGWVALVIDAHVR